MTDFQSQLVARFTNGEVLRGSSFDFEPDAEFFHIYEEGSAIPFRVMREALKALFFVRSLAGDPNHVEAKNFHIPMHEGRKLWIEFQDGEKLAGFSEDYDPRGDHFFLRPADPTSNAIQAYIPLKSLNRVLVDEEAQKASMDYEPAPRPAPEPPRKKPQVRKLNSSQWDLFIGDYGDKRPERAKHPPTRPRKQPSREKQTDDAGESSPFLGDW